MSPLASDIRSEAGEAARSATSGPSRLARVVGWTGVTISAGFASLWSFWGSIENFHEGWYLGSLPKNLGLMVTQYLSVPAIIAGAALLAIRWPWLGALVHAVAAVVAWEFLRGSGPATKLLISGPLLVVAIFYGLGRPRPRRAAAMAVLILPLVTALAGGVGPALRVAHRLDDGNTGARVVEGNGVSLMWAPAGPGWPRQGIRWSEAVERCRHLTPNGLALADTSVDAWRLPTVEEAVHSMSLHGRNAGGTWDPRSARAAYRFVPDKESPLWDVRSPIIYWWTGTPAPAGRAYVIVYDGTVRSKDQRLRMGDLGFRAVHR